METTKVIYEVESIRGTCPVYSVGDRLVIDSSEAGRETVNMNESDAVCVRVIDNMWTRLLWQFGEKSILDHVVGVNGECRISCPMPGEPYTRCGNAVFRIRREGDDRLREKEVAWETRFEEDGDTQYPPMEERPAQVEYPAPGCQVEVTVDKVYGCCPVSVEGDKMVFGGPGIDHQAGSVSSDLPDFWGSAFPGTRHGTLCPIALQTILPYVNSMMFGVSTDTCGLSLDGRDGFVICPAWGPPNCEALVIFRLHPIPIEKNPVDAWYEELAKVGHFSVPSYIFERFASEETKQKRQALIEEWKRLGKPFMWEGWRNPPCQPQRSRKK